MAELQYDKLKGAVMAQAVAWAATGIMDDWDLNSRGSDSEAAQLRGEAQGAGLGLWAAYSLLVQAAGGKPRRPCDLLPPCFTHASSSSLEDLLDSLRSVSQGETPNENAG